MKSTVFSLLVALLFGLSAHGQASGTSSAAAASPCGFGFAADFSVAPGLNGVAPRSVQLAAVASYRFGSVLSAGLGMGLRHAHALVSVDKNIYGYGEDDQLSYGGGLLLPLFLRLGGAIPPGRFRGLGADFVPFVRVDAGYAVPLSTDISRRAVGGVFAIPAAGLSMRLHDGRQWLVGVGVGFHSARHWTTDWLSPRPAAVAEGQPAISLNLSAAYAF